MASVLRGEIYWANLNPVRGYEQGGRRPVLILSHDIFNERSGTVIAIALTSQHQRAGYPLTWRLPDALLGRSAWVKVSQIRVLATERLGDRVSRLDDAAVMQIVNGLHQLIG